MNILNNMNQNGMSRTLSAASFRSTSITSDSVFDDSYTNTTNNKLLSVSRSSSKLDFFIVRLSLQVPSSPTMKSRDDSKPYLKSTGAGGIELVVPSMNRDLEAGPECNRGVSVRSVKFEVDEIDIANEIDHKCRYIFPISFVVINLIYWITLSMMSYYD